LPGTEATLVRSNQRSLLLVWTAMAAVLTFAAFLVPRRSDHS
jgi:hypothetical protein